jgi:hypothetical protein
MRYPALQALSRRKRRRDHLRQSSVVVKFVVSKSGQTEPQRPVKCVDRCIGAVRHQTCADGQSVRRAWICYRQANGGHCSCNRSLGTNLRIQSPSDHFRRLCGEFPITLPKFRATQPMMELDRCFHCQEAAGFGGSGPVELCREAQSVTVRDCARVQAGLCSRRCMQERATLWGTQPFVAVTHVPVGADLRQIEIYLPGCVGAIDQNRYARCVESGR